MAGNAVSPTPFRRRGDEGRQSCSQSWDVQGVLPAANVRLNGSTEWRGNQQANHESRIVWHRSLRLCLGLVETTARLLVVRRNTCGCQVESRRSPQLLACLVAKVQPSSKCCPQAQTYILCICSAPTVRRRQECGAAWHCLMALGDGAEAPLTLEKRGGADGMANLGRTMASTAARSGD